MDTVLLFALPLVGGLIFCNRFNYTRWRTAREDGHRLYFRAVFFGAIIFAVVAGARTYLEARFPILAAIEAPIKAVIKPMVKEGIPVDAITDLSITCFLSMLLGAPLAWLMNLVFWKDVWLRHEIKKKDDFEEFLLDAADREFPIMATMDDGKVYVGYIVEGFNPAEDRKSLLLLPLMSGYRNKETQKLTFTTFYVDLYGSDPLDARSVALPGKLEHLYADDFITWLPVDRVASCRLFDAVAYLEFQKRGPPATAAAPPPLSAVSGPIQLASAPPALLPVQPTPSSSADDSTG